MTSIALQALGLSKRFGGVLALRDASFAVTEGSLCALIGPNGAGKSTIFNLVTNFYPASSGEVLLFGERLAGRSAAGIAAAGLVRTFQTARVFPGMTTLQNLLAGARMREHSSAAAQMLWLPGARREERALTRQAEALLDLVGLSAFRDAAATDLPMGAQKMLEVIRALMARPRVLLLDEPAAGLNDTETSELSALLCAVRAHGITVMVVEHNMNLVMNIADQIVVLDAGSVVADGTPAEIRINPRVIEAYIGKDEMSGA
ncbi:ABC transporter ATP-binding protein (plasmid) [Roseomonas sp. OT10]|uniref:ABC transporter ATP-binding protein n=1 Tax=Roseomonas cutis TaxID=2897332 RepID=UPI001E5D6C75|nr:ABC transporter ATP-binding protein [Roseomonas sp. OT10]UFN51531.1 ABC transporter ATP-binding protein [Roseomonas sp. OT10]